MPEPAAGGRAANAEPDPAWSNRDGIAARVEIELDDAVRVRELRNGEGLAAQNSAVLRVGIGDRAGARTRRPLQRVYSRPCRPRTASILDSAWSSGPSRVS